jgi:membrane-associated phospholipid phosphatase
MPEAPRARDPRTTVIAVLVVVLVAALLAFAGIVEDYLTGDPIVRFDVDFSRWLHEHAWHNLVTVFKVITLAGNATVLGLIVLAAAIVLVRRRLVSEAALLVLAFGGSAVLNALLKLIFHRPRPELAFVHLGTYSFPSGHAAVSSATFSTAAYLLGRRYRSTGARVLIALTAAAAILLVGFSRLYLGAHYLSDVLAGISFGVAWAAVCLIAYTIWGERDPTKGGPLSKQSRTVRLEA